MGLGDQYDDELISNPGEYLEFIEALEQFLATRGEKLVSIPVLGSKKIDLLHVYRAVCREGGYQQVTEQKKWRQLTLPMNLPATCTNSAYILRTVYKKYLFAYEQKFVFNLDLPTPSPPPTSLPHEMLEEGPRKSRRIVESANKNIKAREYSFSPSPLPHNSPSVSPLLPNSTTAANAKQAASPSNNEAYKSSQVNSSLVANSKFSFEHRLFAFHCPNSARKPSAEQELAKRITLSFKSQLPNEIDWAFNELIKLSFNTRGQFEMKRILGLTEQLFKFLELEIASMDLTIQQKEGDLISERMLQIMLIFRNFCQFDNEAIWLANQPIFLAFVDKCLFGLPESLPFVSSLGIPELKNYSLEIVEALSSFARTPPRSLLRAYAEFLQKQHQYPHKPHPPFQFPPNPNMEAGEKPQLEAHAQFTLHKIFSRFLELLQQSDRGIILGAIRCLTILVTNENYKHLRLLDQQYIGRLLDLITLVKDFVLVDAISHLLLFLCSHSVKGALKLVQSCPGSIIQLLLSLLLEHHSRPTDLPVRNIVPSFPENVLKVHRHDFSEWLCNNYSADRSEQIALPQILSRLRQDIHNKKLDIPFTSAHDVAKAVLINFPGCQVLQFAIGSKVHFYFEGIKAKTAADQAKSNSSQYQQTGINAYDDINVNGSMGNQYHSNSMNSASGSGGTVTTTGKYYHCGWRGCTFLSSTKAELFSHCRHRHLPKGIRAHYCQWEDCHEFQKVGAKRPILLDHIREAHFSNLVVRTGTIVKPLHPPRSSTFKSGMGMKRSFSQLNTQESSSQDHSSSIGVPIPLKLLLRLSELPFIAQQLIAYNSEVFDLLSVEPQWSNCISTLLSRIPNLF